MARDGPDGLAQALTQALCTTLWPAFRSLATHPAHQIIVLLWDCPFLSSSFCPSRSSAPRPPRPPPPPPNKPRWVTTRCLSYRTDMSAHPQPDLTLFPVAPVNAPNLRSRSPVRMWLVSVSTAPVATAHEVGVQGVSPSTTYNIVCRRELCALLL